jgi:hypothetical protein
MRGFHVTLSFSLFMLLGAWFYHFSDDLVHILGFYRQDLSLVAGHGALQGMLSHSNLSVVQGGCSVCAPSYLSQKRVHSAHCKSASFTGNVVHTWSRVLWSCLVNLKFVLMLLAAYSVVIQKMSFPLAGSIGGCNDFNFPTDDCSSFWSVHNALYDNYRPAWLSYGNLTCIQGPGIETCLSQGLVWDDNAAEQVNRSILLLVGTFRKFPTTHIFSFDSCVVRR